MPNQDGIRFLFDIQDKISAKLIKIEAKAKASKKRIDKYFTQSSKAQEVSSLKLAAIEQRRVAAAQSNSTKLAAIEQRRMAAAEKAAAKNAVLLKRESDARARFAAKAVAAEQRHAAAADKAHAKSLTRLKRQTEAFKRSMTRIASAATVAFAAIAGKALTMAGGYDKAMRSVQAKTGATGAFLEKLSAQSREMGRTTVHSATEAARGQAFLAQAGFDANEILEALPATLALATAGELDLASAADIASNVLSGFRLETEHTGRVTDVLAAIAAKTNTSVSQMGVALAKAAPAAAAAGWSLEQTAAAIGRLSDAGIQGEEAGTVLKTMLARLAAPTGKLEELMAATGISVKDTTGKMLPLNDIIAQLAPHADNTGLMFELLGTRGANAGLILGSLAKDDLQNLTAELENSKGAAQAMADTMGGGLWGSIKKIQSIVESAFISFGERLAPAVKKVADVFGGLPGPIQEVIVVTGSLAGAMGGLMLLMPQTFGSLVQFPGKLIHLANKINLVKVATVAMSLAQKAAAAAQWLINVAMTANPIGLVIAAIALAVAAWIKWDDEIKTFLRLTWDKLKKGFFAFKGWVTEAFGVLKGWLDKIPTPILALMGPIGLVMAIFRKWDDIKDIARDVYYGIKRWMSDKLGAIFDGIKRKIEAVTGFFSKMKYAIVGGSIIPDMVDAIGLEFGRMGTVMEKEVVTGADRVSSAFSSIGGAIGGVAGKVMGELKNIASAFAKGGVAGAIMAGVGSLVKGIAGLFGRARRKREKAAKEARAAAEAAAARAAEIAAAQKSYWDSVYGSAINAYDRASAAGVGAYDKIFLAALESGAGQEEAVAKATAAQLAASEKILAAEGEKFARIAAFEAALDAVRSGNAAVAGALARKAATETRVAWKTALSAVAEADKVTTATMKLSSTELTNHILADQRRAAKAQEAIRKSAAERYQRENELRQQRSNLHFGGMAGAEGFEGFQHGGQVQAGRPIIVGEGGPEMFIPSQRGRIEPNGSTGASIDPKALARAIKDALQDTSVEIDGRKFGRLSIRHQPLAVAELGGRR